MTSAANIEETPLSPPASPERLVVPVRVIGIFAAAIIVTYLGLLGHGALAEPDEARYGEIAREMLQLRDWVTPHLNYVKYFEKPPLVYWLTALNEHLFGPSEFVVRLWPALLGLLGIALTDALGCVMYGSWTGHVAAALLAATPLYFGLSQIVILDMPLTAMLTLALAAFWFAYTATSGRWRDLWVLVMYAATALGVLIKGPVAVVLTGGIIVAFLLMRWEWAVLRWAISRRGIILFLVMVLPWFALVSYRNPEFLEFFIVKQHLARYLTPDEHQQSVWFFVPIIWAGMLPWSLLLLAPRRLYRFAVRVVTRRASAATLFCVLWAGIVCAFFSLSGSKLATYILPMFCPLALLAARYFAQVIGEQRAVILRRGGIALAVLAGILLIGALVIQVAIADPRARSVLAQLYLGSLVVGLTARGVWWWLRRDALAAGFATLVFGVLVLQAVAISGRGVAQEYRRLAYAIGAQAKPEDMIVSYRHYVQGIPFYAQRRMVMAGGRGELDFGSRQGDQAAYFWDSENQLRDAWGSGRHMFLVINVSELDDLHLQPPPRQIAAYGKKIVVVNFE